MANHGPQQPPVSTPGPPGPPSRVPQPIQGPPVPGSLGNSTPPLPPGGQLNFDLVGAFITNVDNLAIGAEFTAWANDNGRDAEPYSQAGVDFVSFLLQEDAADTGGGGSVGRTQFPSEVARDFAQAEQASAQAALLVEMAVSERLGRELTRVEIIQIREEIISEILGRELTKAEIELTRARVETERSQQELLHEQSLTQRFDRERGRSQDKIQGLQFEDQERRLRTESAIQSLINAAPSLINPGTEFFPGGEPGGALDILANLVGGGRVPDSARRFVPVELPINELLAPGAVNQTNIDQFLPSLPA